MLWGKAREARLWWLGHVQRGDSEYAVEGCWGWNSRQEVKSKTWNWTWIELEDQSLRMKVAVWEKRMKGRWRKMIWCDNPFKKMPKEDTWNSCNSKCRFNSILVMTTFNKHHFELYILYINYISCESGFTLNTSHWMQNYFHCMSNDFFTPLFHIVTV